MPLIKSALRRRAKQNRAHRKLEPRGRHLAVEGLENRRLLSIIQWSGGASGTGTNFETAANWVGGVLPGPSDEAYIPSAFASETITSATSITIQSLVSEVSFQITGGTFTVAAGSGTGNTATPGTVEVDNQFTLGGGTLAGATVKPGSGGQGLICTSSGQRVNPAQRAPGPDTG